MRYLILVSFLLLSACQKGDGGKAVSDNPNQSNTENLEISYVLDHEKNRMTGNLTGSVSIRLTDSQLFSMNSRTLPDLEQIELSTDSQSQWKITLKPSLTAKDDEVIVISNCPTTTGLPDESVRLGKLTLLYFPKGSTTEISVTSTSQTNCKIEVTKLPVDLNQQDGTSLLENKNVREIVQQLPTQKSGVVPSHSVSLRIQKVVEQLADNSQLKRALIASLSALKFKELSRLVRQCIMTDEDIQDARKFMKVAKGESVPEVDEIQKIENILAPGTKRMISETFEQNLLELKKVKDSLNNSSKSIVAFFRRVDVVRNKVEMITGEVIPLYWQMESDAEAAIAKIDSSIRSYETKQNEFYLEAVGASRELSNLVDKELFEQLFSKFTKDRRSLKKAIEDYKLKNAESLSRFSESEIRSLNVLSKLCQE